MTHLDHSYSAAAVQRTALLDLLRARGEDGASVAEMVDAGGMWWRTRLKEIRRWKLAVIGEQDGRFYLVSEPVSTEASGERRPAIVFESGPASAGTLGQAPDASVDTEPLSLFPSGSSHYREAA